MLCAVLHYWSVVTNPGSILVDGMRLRDGNRRRYSTVKVVHVPSSTIVYGRFCVIQRRREPENFAFMEKITILLQQIVLIIFLR